MKSNMKRIIIAAFILTVLLVPTVGAVQTTNTDAEDIIFSIHSRRGRIYMSIINSGDESVNYTLVVAYGFLRQILLKRLLPTFIFENGTIPANSSVNKMYRVRFSFSPIVAMLEADNRTLICIGRVFGRRVIFKSVGVIDKSLIVVPAIIEE